MEFNARTARPELLTWIFAAEIFFAGAHVVPGILHLYVDPVPLSIVERMGRVIADRQFARAARGDRDLDRQRGLIVRGFDALFETLQRVRRSEIQA